jgi:hypothetical protein
MLSGENYVGKHLSSDVVAQRASKLENGVLHTTLAET